MTRLRLLACAFVALLAAGTARADGRLQRFVHEVRGKGFAGVKPLSRSKGASAQLGWVRGTAIKVVLRSPGQLQEAMSFHNAVYKMAIELGAGHLVEPATTAKTPQGPRMVMRFAEGFNAAIDSTPRSARLVPERIRLLAATIDLLTDQTDRSIRNVLLSPEGQIRLIDHDGADGKRDLGQRGGVRSAFFPGEPLGYASPQRSFAELPPAAHALVTRLSRASLQSIVEDYGYSLPQARRLQRRANLIVTHGLTGSIQQWTSHRRSPGYWFTPQG